MAIIETLTSTEDLKKLAALAAKQAQPGPAAPSPTPLLNPQRLKKKSATFNAPSQASSFSVSCGQLPSRRSVHPFSSPKSPNNSLQQPKSLHLPSDNLKSGFKNPKGQRFPSLRLFEGENQVGKGPTPTVNSLASYCATRDRTNVVLSRRFQSDENLCSASPRKQLFSPHIEEEMQSEAAERVKSEEEKLREKLQKKGDILPGTSSADLSWLESREVVELVLNQGSPLWDWIRTCVSEEIDNQLELQFDDVRKNITHQ
eukprot:CAMPEP_0174275090 /NCGR_PEP_ID=MMETSP0439-20130205/59639_1 /TAXON_ID=0 /ORGANISM="Stereomyxa ramosa, Strain Chinc5" /LENGTH=257 /DNA_ID=CAMNT_0015367167 /DNA_START=565 /DNA_END=1335 /DNA_ORIENTATION=-